MTLSPCQIEVARNMEELEKLRGSWKAMPSRIDADFDFFAQFIRVYSDFVLRPHVIVLHKGEKIVAILPGRLERQSPKVHIGYKEFALPSVKQLTFVGELLGEATQENAAKVVESVEASLRQREADVAFFHQADSEEWLHRTVQRAGNIFTRDYFEESEENWRSRIPREYDTFLKSRSGNTRHNLKRYSKRLLEAYPGRVHHRVFRNVGDVDVIFRECEAIAAKSYHRGLGVGFFDDRPTRQLFSLAARHGWLRSYVLYIDGDPAAFWNGFLYRTTFTARDTAFNAAISELRPGLYLLQRVVEELCAEKSVDMLDFGTGSAQYKRDMCDTSNLRVSRFLFAATWKGVLTNFLRTPPLALARGAKWAATSLGFFDKVRKEWRTRLATTRNAEATTAKVPTVESRKDP